MQTGVRQTDKLVKEYTALAPAYDQRWSDYIDASLGMTMEFVADLPADRVLDVACGTGQLLQILAGRQRQPALVGIDRVPAMLDAARQRIGEHATLLEGEAERLPFDDAGFQMITSTNALHYFSDARAALREMRRVIAPSGNLIVTDWCRDFFWMKLLNRLLPWTSHAHVHTFDTKELEQKLTAAGFRVVATTRRKIDWFWGLMTLHATPV